jgi:hypothetical protein
MKVKLHVAVWALLFLTVAVRAQQPTVRNFTPVDYNGGTQNWCISQSADKRMLFANNRGLLAYDSGKWFLFPIVNRTIVRSVWYDKGKNFIYVGATNEFGYYCIDPVTYMPRYISLSRHLPQRYRFFDEVWGVYGVGTDMVFVCKRYIFVLHENGRFTVYSVKTRIDASALLGVRLILACKDGAYALEAGRMVRLKGTETLGERNVRSIMPYDGGRMLFATASDGLYIYDGKQTSPLLLDITPFLKDNQIFCGAKDENMLAFGTIRGGMVAKDMAGEQNYYANIMTGLQNNTVLSMFFDNRNNIWLGLDNGLSYVLIDAPYKELFGSSSLYGTGYASLVSGHQLYLGTNQGLFVTDFPIPNRAQPEQPALLPGMAGQVWCIREIGGHILCGNNDGAFSVNGMRSERIKGPEGTWDFLPLVHHVPYVLACDYQGLYTLKNEGGRWTFAGRVAGFNETSAAVLEDADGTIWMSHWQKGVYHLWLSNDLRSVGKIVHYDAKNGLATNADNIISRINGRIVISSVDGFHSYDKRTGKLRAERGLDRLFEGLMLPLRLFETPKGDVWVVNNTTLGIARRKMGGGYGLDTLSYHNIARRMQIDLGHITFVDSTHTIFNVQNGFISMENEYARRSNSANLFIRRVVGINDNERVMYTFSTTDRKKRVEIPHNQNSIRMEFVWPEYSNEKAVIYTCYMEHYDKQWAAPQTTTWKEYTQLKKGTYIFHVRGYNSVSGTTQETQIEIKILPAWYETWWAYLIYILLFLCAGYYILKYIRFRYGRKLKILEARRERELREKDALFQAEHQKRERELMGLRNEQLERELKHKSSELADSTMNLIRKNDMLQSLDEELGALHDAIRRDEGRVMITSRIRSLHHNIQNNIKEDENWEKFEENFNVVYDNYMKRLNVRFPDLNAGERRLCAYLRMGLSSKDVAALMNTSVRSVETARYRLRKKLDLGHGCNLSGFIQGI